MSDDEYSSVDECTDAAANKIVKALKSVQVPKTPAGNKRGRPLKGKKAKNGGSPTPSNLSTSTDQDQDLIAIFTNLLKDIKVIKNEVCDLNAYVKDLSKRVTTLENENKTLKDSNKMKDVKIKELENRVDAIEQREKRYQVIVSSPEISSMCNENFGDNIKGQMAQKLGLSKNILDRFTYKRIGIEGKRKALVTVNNDEERSVIFVAAKTTKPNNFFINDALTKNRDQLFFSIRQHKKTNNDIHSVFTIKGNVYIKMTSTSNPVLIKSMDDLDQKLQAA